MNEKDSWLTVGNLVAPQGLRGEIRVKPSSEFPERFIKPGSRWLQKNTEEPKEIKLISGKALPGKEIYIITFKGINDRETAEKLIGKKMLVPSNQRPSLKENEYHLLDLMGLEARIIDRQDPIGHVTNLISGGNELIEIKLTTGKKVLVPFVKQIVPQISLKENWLKINPPPGLLEL